jgi:ABC-type glycerol-3-phosphate transport system permease component
VRDSFLTPVVANSGESENWVESATIATVLSSARTWSEELAAAVVFSLPMIAVISQD